MGVEARTQVCRDGGLEDSPITSRNHPLRSRLRNCQLRVDLKKNQRTSRENHLRFLENRRKFAESFSKNLDGKRKKHRKGTHIWMFLILSHWHFPVLAWMISCSAKNLTVFLQGPCSLFSRTFGWDFWMIHLWNLWTYIRQSLAAFDSIRNTVTSKEFRSDCRTQTCDLPATGTRQGNGNACAKLPFFVSTSPFSPVESQWSFLQKQVSWCNITSVFPLQKMTHKFVAKVFGDLRIWGSHTQ